MVVNRGFFAARRLCCLAAAAWGFPELLVLHQAQPQLSLRQKLCFQGWPGPGAAQKVPPELNTKAA